jgi:hypothetical protein
VPKIAATTTTFGGSIQRAWSDAESSSVDMILRGIRLVGLLAPIFVLLVLPSGLFLWASLRVMRWFSARKSRRMLAAAI